MDLKIKDIVDLLQVSEKTVYRWIKDKKIPCYRINHQYRFNRSEINEWILSNKIELSSKALDLTLAARPTNFYDLLKHGGIFENISGNSVTEVLSNCINAIPTPENLPKDDILSALLNREELMTTAIGNGIALPHPRVPVIADIEDANVSICYLKSPVDFGALDNKQVHTLFILLTNNPRRHLEVLSKIAFLCQMDSFVDMLRRRAPFTEVLDFIRAKELEWRK